MCSLKTGHAVTQWPRMFCEGVTAFRQRSTTLNRDALRSASERVQMKQVATSDAFEIKRRFHVRTVCNGTVVCSLASQPCSH